MQRSQSRASRQTFTLIELLVVVAIIAILASMLLPALTEARAKARKASCVNQLKQMSLSLMQYGDDMQDYLPGRSIPYPREYTWYVHYARTQYTGPIALGVLVTSGYISKADGGKLFYCPGRSQGQRLTAPFAGGGAGAWSAFPSGWQESSYVCATADYNKTGAGDMQNAHLGKWHRFGTASAAKPLVFDYNMLSTDPATGYSTWAPWGASRHHHGTGYNIGKFDGSVAWHLDPGSYMESTFDSYAIMPWRYDLANMPYYLMIRVLGWTDAEYRQACPSPY